MRSQTQDSVDGSERLSHLIALKRLEKPDAAFWGRFDDELKQKRLSATVEIQGMLSRRSSTSSQIARLTGFFALFGSIAAIALFVLTQNQTAPTSESEVASNSNAKQLAPEFSVDSADIKIRQDKQQLGVPVNHGAPQVN